MTNQSRVTTWVREVFSEADATNAPERSLRLVEEAIELSQACGIGAEAVHRLVDYVFSRPVGVPPQEIAGCMVTLYAAAAALGIDAQEEFETELARIQQPEIIERVRRRQAEKRAALVALPELPGGWRARAPSGLEGPKKTHPVKLSGPETEELCERILAYGMAQDHGRPKREAIAADVRAALDKRDRALVAANALIGESADEKKTLDDRLAIAELERDHLRDCVAGDKEQVAASRDRERALREASVRLLAIEKRAALAASGMILASEEELIARELCAAAEALDQIVGPVEPVGLLALKGPPDDQ